MLFSKTFQFIAVGLMAASPIAAKPLEAANALAARDVNAPTNVDAPSIIARHDAEVDAPELVARDPKGGKGGSGASGVYARDDTDSGTESDSD